MATDISKLGVKATWEELTEGMIVAGAGTSKEFNTFLKVILQLPLKYHSQNIHLYLVY